MGNKHNIGWKPEGAPPRRPRPPRAHLDDEREHKYRVGVWHGVRATLKAVCHVIDPVHLERLNDWQLGELESWTHDPAVSAPMPKPPELGGVA